MPLKEGYRASSVRSVTLTTTGIRASIRCTAVSLSRLIRTVDPSTVTDEAWVSAGRPSRSATNVGTTPPPPSVEAMPNSTMSASSLPMAAASTADVANTSDPAMASSCTCTASPTPICIALRSA
jgi:hypothetical protein